LLSNIDYVVFLDVLSGFQEDYTKHNNAAVTLDNSASQTVNDKNLSHDLRLHHFMTD